ncbi:MAG: hypothetical protein U0800_05840 [Isosphaeraceae bacterium]
MNTIAVLMLAGTATISGFDDINKPSAYKHWLRPHAVQHGAPPPGGMIGGPGLGVPGAGVGGPAARQFANTKSQIYFVDPPGMRIGWQSSVGGQPSYLNGQLTAPARYNFTQGYIYRLKLTEIPGRPGLALYPTIEVAPGTPATDAFLTHNPIPVQFTEEDFDQVTAGNFVTKVIYLPDPKYQELAIAGVETLVSTRLEPGVDPILEADRRGTILLILRVGAIDLEMPSQGVSAPTSIAPPVLSSPANGGVAPPTVLPPGSLPPGNAPAVTPVAPPATPPIPDNVPVDTAPVSPAPPGPGPGR